MSIQLISNVFYLLLFTLSAPHNSSLPHTTPKTLPPEYRKNPLLHICMNFFSTHSTKTDSFHSFHLYLVSFDVYSKSFATSHTPAIPNSTTENTADNPNTSVPTANERINPARLRTAPSSLPHMPKSKPTPLKTTAKNIIANKIGIQTPPIYFLFSIRYAS